MARSVRLKDHWAEQRMFGRRVIAATFVILLLVAALFSRLFYLQVVRHEYFSDLSQGNRIRIEPIPPSRGLILDRNGEPLALNRPAYQLELVREQTPDLEDTLARLVQIGLLPAEDLDRTRRAIQARRRFDAVPIRLQLSEEELARFAVNRPDFPGVEVRPRLTRFYPKGGTGVHAIGYVGSISEQDQERIDVPNYAGTTLIGKLGVERAFEDELHGQTGHQQLLVNAQGRRVDRVGLSTPQLQRGEPIAGNDLYLAVDARVQQVAEEALAGQRAAVVAIDPRNGDIIAFVSTPTFDPNGFARGLTYAEYNALSTDIDVPLYDRALRGVYPPGSTIKPLVAFAALQHGVIEPAGAQVLPGRVPAARLEPPLPGLEEDRATAASTCTWRSRSPATSTSTASRRTWASTGCTNRCRCSAWARRPASTSPANAPACCRRRRGSAARSRSARPRSGSRAKR